MFSIMTICMTYTQCDTLTLHHSEQKFWDIVTYRLTSMPHSSSDNKWFVDDVLSSTEGEFLMKLCLSCSRCSSMFIMLMMLKHPLNPTITENWNSTLWKRRTHLFFVVNSIAPVVLKTPEAKDLQLYCWPNSAQILWIHILLCHHNSTTIESV